MFRARRLPIKSEVASFHRRNNVIMTEKTKPVQNIKDMPHPRSFPIFGTKLNFLITGKGTKLHEYVDIRHKQLGPIFCECLGGSTNLVFISDPVLMKSLFLNLEGKYPAHILPDPWVLYEKLYGSKRGLFFMNGEEWLCNRRIMNKHLLQTNVEEWLEKPIKETVAKFLLQWQRRAQKDSFIPNLESEFYRLSTDVIIKVLLGTKTSHKETQRYEELVQLFSESVKKIFQTTTKLYSIPVHLCHRFNLKVWRDFKESVDLSLLLAQKLVNEMLNVRYKNTGLIKKLSEENISNELITRIIADFVIAAGDTTAYTSLWVMYLLSQQDETKEEIRAVGGSYVKYVLKEAMRLYPVAPFLTRILPKDCDFGSYTLDGGTPVIASIYTSGRDEQNFSRAKDFLPYRWDRNDPRKQNLLNHVTSASLPFALGARSCIGKKIAMVQLTEIIHQIVENFDFKCTNRTEVKPITSQVLVPNQNIEILLSLRNK